MALQLSLLKYVGELEALLPRRVTMVMCTMALRRMRPALFLPQAFTYILPTVLNAFLPFFCLLSIDLSVSI